MLSVNFSLFVTFFLVTIRGVSCEGLTPVKDEESSLEDSTVTLSYRYSKSAAANDYFFWYRQYPGKPPEFLISHSGTGTIFNDPNSGLSVNNFKERGSIVVKKASGRPRKSSKRQDRLLKLIQLRDRGTTIAELAQEWQQAGGSVTERTESKDVRGDGEIQGGAKLLLNYRRERNFHIQQSPRHKTNFTLFNMMSLQYCVLSLVFLSTLTGVSCEGLTPVKDEESSLEDSTVTLYYRYSKTITGSDNFFWYRQYPRKPPEFLLYISGTNFTRPAESLESDTKFSTKLSGEKHLDLQISSAAVTDSALYYCAVRPTVTANPQSLYKNLTAPH
ncbi:uncharacterized protein [Enoplosus armatus]|uniref:uncharacterized protein n=1 Tax=Enoplosus armatus TaxID=215367 RepID=UPI00399542AD